MLTITSSAFINNGKIPIEYTCKGKGIGPALKIENIPPQTQSLVLIMDDPDAPIGVFTHWLIWNIAPDTSEIKENSVPVNAVVGLNSRGENKYTPPCPPSGTHRYFFKIFALGTTLNLPRETSQKQLEEAINEHIIDSGELIGLFNRD